MPHKSFGILHGVLLLIIGFGLANPSTASAMRLEQAISRAMHDNASLMAAKSRIEAARGSVDLAKSGYMPKIGLSETYFATNSPMRAFGVKLNQERITGEDFDPALLNNPETISNWRTTIFVEQSLYRGGRVYYANRMAESNVKSASLDTETARKEIRFAIIERWFALWLLTKKMEVLEKSKELAKESVKVTEDKSEAGLTLTTDVLDVKINLERVRKNINDTKAEMATAHSSIKALLGMGDDEKFTVQFGEYEVPPFRESLNALVEEGRKSRPDLQKLVTQIGEAEDKLRSTRGALHPALGMTYDYNLDGKNSPGGDGDSWIFAIRADINLFAGGRDKAKIAIAKANLTTVKFLYESKRAELKVEIENNYRKLLTNVENMVISLSQSTLAERSHAITKERYLEGAVDTRDLLKAETQLEEAKLGYYESRYKIILARAQLDLTLGRNELSIMERTE